MNLINRDVVIIKPKEPFLEWINRSVDLSRPIYMKELEQDCTAILVPDLYSMEDALDYLEPLKPALFEMELEGWHRDPATWPQDRTPKLFDVWFDLEVHSMVWDAVADPVLKEEDEEIHLDGTWGVVSSPDFNDDYLYMETTPYVRLRQREGGVSGDFHIGLIRGSLDGRREGGRVLFSFEGMDELEQVSGAGTITQQGDQLIFKLSFYLGDEFTFECVPRQSS